MALVGSGLTVSIREISQLYPHEDVIATHVQTLEDEMKEDGVQRDPVLIDKDSGVVLDGMHRLAALTRMGHQNVVACSVDYQAKSIELGRWARVFDVGEAAGAAEALEGAGFEAVTSPAAAKEDLDNAKAAVVGFVAGKGYVRKEMADLEQAFELVRRLDVEAELRRWPRTFMPEAELDEERPPEGAMVLLVRRLSKADVLAAGVSGKKFPCKTSMHSLDPRPVAVNFRIGDLDLATDLGLARMLKVHEPKVLPAGSVYKGRKYKERLLMLSPP